MAITPRKKAPIVQTKPEPEEEISAPDAQSMPSVIFRSREPENRQFVVNRVRSRRCLSDMRYLEWRVPTKDAEAFAKHHFVVTGRILRVAE